MRVFKTKWFNKAAKAHNINDSELQRAITAVKQGKGSDLGGGVYKHRLNQNRDRAIILAKGGEWQFYNFLHAKQYMKNIDLRELAGFRELVKYYATLNDEKVKVLINSKELVEISHDYKN